MNILKGRALKKILGTVVVLIVIVLFTNTLTRNWDNVQQLDITLGIHSVIATVFFFLAVVFSGYLWGRVFERISGKRVGYREAVRSHSAAWLLKYVPGQVGAFVYKLQWAKGEGIGKKDATVAFAYETLFLTLASTVIIIPVLLISVGDRTDSSLLVIYVLGLMAFLFLSGKFMNTLIGKFIRKITGMEVAKKYILSLKGMSIFTAWFSISRLLNAIGFVVLAASILPVTPGMYVPLGAAYVFAGIVGMYAIMVPSGLGVREAVVAVFASTYFPPEQAIVAALLARLYATVADGLVALLYVYLTRSNNKKVAS
ncbi:lysylphosphatidylglycerol synthase transmembrane domain-containing protein [soil metagenome]